MSDTSTSVNPALRSGAATAQKTIQETNEADASVDEVTLFAKLMKKSEEAAQSAL